MRPFQSYLANLVRSEGTQSAVGILKRTDFATSARFSGCSNFPYGIAIDDREGNTYKIGLCKGFGLQHSFADLSDDERAKAESHEIR